MRTGHVSILLAVLGAAWAISGASADFESIDRPMAVAGQFYPADPEKLSADIDKYLAQAGDTQVPAGDRLVGLVCPHAGYVYSAPVGAWSYRLLAKVKDSIDLVIVVGSSHRSTFRGASLGNYKIWRTPLGPLEVDVELAKKLFKENDFLSNNPGPHFQEHCIEAQLPFIKKIMPDVKILPILMSMHNKDVSKRLAVALSGILDQRKAVVIFSTDLSHYQPYERAVATDKKSIEGICSAPADEFFKKMDSDEFSMCGGGPISVMKYLGELREHEEKPVLLKYMNSGDTAGDKSRVVGYAAMALFEDPNAYKPQE